MIDVSKLATVQQCRNLMGNAKRLGREDVRRAALRRCVQLQAPTDTDPVVGGFGGMLVALEEVFLQRYGRALKANRTRAKAKAAGIMTVLTDWARGRGQGSGFEMLVEEGLGDYTGEYVVAVNPARFGADAVFATRSKLAANGVALPGPT
ncbi:hypothetical protein [Bradyrhizobium diazoefficiens]|nr:hypothetical protein [Bradyrhizobium diazoefficiens]MBR0867294.1 hypothetical protein [Bradyrhizobium diazoefficiens]MBR0891804.1 hypothetical protein [Bradyrhizobium diazoefficiens]MBR0923544.1 hypothetical protein [Bradyrhizobium diazoefficiens]